MVNAPLREIGFGFAGSQDQYGVVIIVPLWLPTLTASAVALVPYSTRTWWRFSLRTLFIITTIVSLTLGLVIFFANN